MTDRYVLLVDAGYLIASAGALLHSTPNRRSLQIDPAGLVATLGDEAARQLTGAPLRTYWYDAASDRVPTTEHRALAVLPGVKVRLGHLNRQGQQKGVDALLRSDLEVLARNRALAHAVLLTGDEDMLPAVEAAQSYGVQVHLWSVEPPFGRNQSERLTWEADTTHELGRSVLAPYVTLVVRPQPVSAAGSLPAGSLPAAAGPEQSPPGVPAPRQVEPSEPSEPSVVAAHRAPSPALLAALPRHAPAQITGPDLASVAEVGEHVAGKWLVTRDDLADLLPGPVLPMVLDRELLVAAEEQLGRSLRPWEDARRALRDGFFARLRREFVPSV